ncbi:MAG: hypothetical protein EXR71_11295 [Myxococcales bacterium]|nr:hypothetical protein [Myxococcales bacterium]
MSLRRQLARCVLGVVLALGAVEAAYWARDDGAFPHLNVYAPDEALGTRLLPGSRQRVAFGGNPTTSVRINAQGFRGADWGPPAAGELVVVGDSQVFGLGVEEDESLPSMLASVTGRPTLNAGVPTYGPQEYRAVVQRLLGERKPAIVVVVINLANDLFERDRPNRDRHKVWDGWAVRSETMPDAVVEFPLRRLLFRESHFVHAARRWVYEHEDDADLGVPSEGGLADLLPVTQAAEPEPMVQAQRGSLEEALSGVTPGNPNSVAGRVQQAAQERLYLERDLYVMLQRVDPRWTYDDIVAVEAVKRQNRPGDIVYEREVESARAVTVTAELLKRAVQLRKTVVSSLREWVEAHPNDERAGQARTLLAEWDAKKATLDSLATSLDAVPVVDSPLAGFVRDLKALCEGAGAELVVVALPLDVQVSSSEFEKYGRLAEDMTGTRVLLEELVASSRRAGVRAVELTGALAAAEPGAFLNADLHMSPIGTRAAAVAIARTLDEPRPVAVPGSGFPEGRSRMPTVAEMALAPEITVKGSSRNRCSTRQLREWLLVECAAMSGGHRDGADTVASVHLETAPLETAWSVSRYAAQVIMPLLPGREARVQFNWPRKAMPDVVDGDEPPWVDGRRETLAVRWAGEKATVAFEPSSAAFVADVHVFPAQPTCFSEGYAESWWNVARGCAQTYDECGDAQVCATGSGVRPPACTEGTAAVGSAGWCFALCDVATPCVEGVCTPWQGAGVCL